MRKMTDSQTSVAKMVDMQCVACRKEIILDDPRWPGNFSFLTLNEGGKPPVNFCSEPCAHEFILKTRKDCGTCVGGQEQLKVSGANWVFYCKRINCDVPNDGKLTYSWKTPYIRLMTMNKAALFFSAEKCVHYVNLEEYRQKALKGAVETPKETRFAVCTFCKTKYDTLANLRCPHCGASNSDTIQAER
jgi:hypothetical protein